MQKQRPVVVKELEAVEVTPTVAQVKYVDKLGNELVQKVKPLVVG